MSEDAKNLHFGKGTREAAMSKSFERCTRSQRGIVRISIYICYCCKKNLKPCLTVPLGEVEEKQQGPYRKGRADRGREEMPTSSCGK
jgi:hypothetical protein